MTNDRRALIYGLSAVLLWSTVATAFKLALRELDVLQLLFYAVLFSSLTLLVILWWRGGLRDLGREFLARKWFFLGMGLTNPLAYYLILFRAYDLLPAQQAQPINYTWAITLSLVAIPVLGQRLSRRDLLAAVLGYGGVLVIATRGRVLEMSFDSLEGVLFALASTLIWAGYWIANTRNASEPVTALCINFLVALPFSFILCLLFSSPLIDSWQGLAGAAYVGVFEMGLTFALWASALKLTSGVARVANLIFLSPLISMFFIATVLGEIIHPSSLLGLALIIPGVLIQQAQRPDRSDASAGPNGAR